MSSPPTFFVSLPTKDITATEKFFKALNFDLITAYTDTETLALRLPGPHNSNICLMIHTHSRFKTFMRPNHTNIIDANTTTQGIYTLTAKDKEGVDAIQAKAVAAGGQADPFTMPGHGAEHGMYVRSFTDLDGHTWEAIALIGNGEGCSHEKAEA